MENDIEIVVPPKREFDRLVLVLTRYEGDPELEEKDFFEQRGYWKILADGNVLAYGYGWDFGRRQLKYYSERVLDNILSIGERLEYKEYSESTKKLIALGAFGGPNEPTNKEKWENRKK